MEPLDLTLRPPRSCYAELDGLMLLPRTIDKLRAQLPGGNSGGYFINGRIKGISGYLLERLGVPEDDLRDAVARAANEEEVAAWLRERSDASQYPAINQTLQRIKPKHSEDEDYFREQYAQTLEKHPELERIIDIIDADDRRVFSAFVIFDLDGTLIDSEQIWGEVRKEFVITNGGRWTEGAQAAMMGMRTNEWATYIHDKLSVALEPSFIADRVVAAVAKRLQDPPVLPGAGAALERLAKNFRLGLASSAALPVAQTVLTATGWNRFFVAVVSADEVARGKPAPDVYLRTLDLLDADPSQTAAVEDSASGIRSAHAAALAVVAIPNIHFPPDADALALASRIVANLDALDVSLVDGVLR